MDSRTLKEQVILGNHDTVFSELEKIVTDNDKINDVYVLAGRCNHLRRQINLGHLAADEAARQWSILNSALLNLIDQVAAADGFIASPKDSPVTIAPPLLQLLGVVRQHCQSGDVPFRTAHLLNTALNYPHPAIRQAFTQVSPTLFDAVKQRLANFITTQKEKESGFIAFEWPELEAIQAAWALAKNDNAPAITAKYLLLGILDFPSGTRDMVEEEAGSAAAFQQLTANIRNLNERITPANKTSL